MIEKIVTTCANITDYVYDKSMSGYEFMTKVMMKLNELIDYVNGFQEELDTKENSINITNSRLLDTQGNFTGTWFGDTYLNMSSLIDNNRDQLVYLASQFSDGQTGFVIDGGFFIDTGIDDNYNGGVF